MNLSVSAIQVTFLLGKWLSAQCRIMLICCKQDVGRTSWTVANCQKPFRMKRFIERQQESDPLVNSVDKRVNPWAKKSKCDVLWPLPSVKLSFTLSPFVLMLSGSRPSTPDKWLPKLLLPTRLWNDIIGTYRHSAPPKNAPQNVLRKLNA